MEHIKFMEILSRLFHIPLSSIQTPQSGQGMGLPRLGFENAFPDSFGILRGVAVLPVMGISD